MWTNNIICTLSGPLLSLDIVRGYVLGFRRRAWRSSSDREVVRRVLPG